MKKYIISFLTLIFIISLANVNISGETVALQELLNPSQIHIGPDNIYIVDNSSIYIYSKDKYKFIKKFGRKGEGPGEIQTSRRGNLSLTLKAGKNDLFIQSRNKVMFFDKRGNFIRELKIPTGFIRNLLPVGKFYTGRMFSFGSNRNSIKSAVYLFDNKLNKKKELYKFDSSSGRESFFKIYFPENIFLIRTGIDKIFIVNDKSFKIRVFSSNGDELKNIKLSYTPIKIGGKMKADIKSYYKNESNFSNFWSRIKGFFAISDSYPSIRNFFIDGEKIFIQTFYEKDGKVEFFTLSSDGKFIKKTYIKIKKMNVVKDYPFYINNGKIYQLVENEDEEEWELTVENIL